MAFGVQNPTKKNQQSRSDTFSTQVADLPDSNGNLEEGTISARAKPSKTRRWICRTVPNW